MNIKNTTLCFFLVLSIPLFSQNFAGNKGIVTIETNLSYLDSIKKTFVTDNMASCVDSLWMKELTNLDLYNDITNDIEHINIDEKVDYAFSTELLKARLAAMNAKSPFRIEYNESLENVIKSFLKYRKRSFERLMAISEYYFPMFEEAFAKQNVPLEIKYLSIVESALNPKAVSKMGATGLWQFMYQTGKQYNLKIDSYVDERSDPLKATAAAAQYMSNMYSIFGDWELVLASYNSGPGNVSKAIRRSGGLQNYWNIRKYLPKETQGYVPAFLATMYLYEYHNEHGIKPDRAMVQNFATDTVMIKKQMSFKQISDLLDIPIAQLQLLNPSYKLNVIPLYENRNHFLRLPKDKIAIFTSNEDKVYAYVQNALDRRENPFQNSRAIVSSEGTNSTSERVLNTKTNYYKVERGDNLGTIARKYDVDINDIKKWNHLRSNTIAYGINLKIITKESVVKAIKKEAKVESVSYNSDKESIAAAETKKSKETNTIKTDTISSNGAAYYVVQKNDNLGNIAKKFGASLADIKEWNKLPGTNITLGSTLIVAKNEGLINTPNATVNSSKKKETVTQKEETDYYVKKGDSLYSISKKYPGVSIADLKKWNDISSEEIKPGMKLKISG
jgi:membrane-bound lytic murein transglycosylase D